MKRLPTLHHRHDIMTNTCRLPASCGRRCSRAAFTVACAKGFGKQQASRKGKQGKDSASMDGDAPQAVQQALSAVAQRDQLMARPVDPKEAKRGKLDVVQVKHWGSGEPAQLGDLQVESFTPQYDATSSQPLYELLGRELQLAQSRGALAISGAPPPPFEQWSFKRQRYQQYLADLAEVHGALEGAVAGVLRSAQQGAAAQQEAAAEDGAAQPDAAAGLHAGLQQLQQLARSAAIAADLAALSRQQSAAPAAAGDPSKPSPPSSITPSQTAKAYADYVRKLARDVSSNSSSTSTSNSTSAGPCSSCCKLLAHVYALYITQLTTGGRVGAAAAGKLQLVPAGALALYHSFSALEGDPLQCFVGGMNSVGKQLGSEQVGLVVAELPRAFTKTSLLLDALAHVD